MADAAVERELGGIRSKFFLAFGSIGSGVKNAGITGLLLLYYNQVLGKPAYLVSLAIGIALVVDAFIDPAIGVASDNWRSRFGRRHPFMYAAAIPVGVLYWMIWNPDPGWSDSATFVYLLVFAIMARIAIAMFEIPSNALLAELTSDYNKRTEFLSWRYFFGVLGATLISFYAFTYLLVPDATHKFGQLNPAGYPKYSLIAAIVITASILISCFGLHRYIPHFIVPEVRPRSLKMFFAEVWETVTIKPFLVLLTSALFAGMATGLDAGMANYTLTYFWKLHSNQIAAFSFVGVIAAFLAFTIIVPLSKRFEKKYAAMGASLIAVVVGTGPYVLAMFGWTPDYTSGLLLPLLLFLFTVMAAVAIASAVLAGSMITDVVEYAALQTGRRSEGTFFAALSLMTKTISGVGIFFSGLVLSLADFPIHANPATLDPAIMRHLFMVYVPLLSALHALAIYFFSTYRITRVQHVENVRRLAEEYAMTKVGVQASLLGATLPPPPDAPKPAPAPGE